MNIFLTCLIVGIGLSMDAFSLSLIYGTCGLSFYRQVFLSILVGLFHFFMPLLGVYFGNFLHHYFVMDSNLIVGIIFGVIGIEMMLSIYHDGDVKTLDSIFSYMLFGFTVSVDSLTIGVGLSLITHYYLLASSIFMVVSCLFTFLGLMIGNRLNLTFGKYATFFGGIILLFFAVYYFLNI